MDDYVFEVWLSEISSLTLTEQRRFALASLSAGGIGTEAVARLPAASCSGAQVSSADHGPSDMAVLGARRVATIGCPHCDSHEVGLWGRASALPRYRCKTCRRTFNALTKTPLAHLRKKDKWEAQAGALIEGVTTAKAAKRCGVHYTTAFRWRHRFLAALSNDKPLKLNGIVEGDETFILESCKGKRADMPRKPRKRGGKSTKRGHSLEQIPVIVARDRTGDTTDAVLPRLNCACLEEALGGVVTPDNEFCCDGGTAIVSFARRARIPAHVLPMPGKPNPAAPDFHLNNVNAYHGRLKEWLRRFHGVATKNLPNYLGWRRTLEALGHNPTPQDFILGAIGLGPYQQKTQ